MAEASFDAMTTMVAQDTVLAHAMTGTETTPMGEIKLLGEMVPLSEMVPIGETEALSEMMPMGEAEALSEMGEAEALLELTFTGIHSTLMAFCTTDHMSTFNLVLDEFNAWTKIGALTLVANPLLAL